MTAEVYQIIDRYDRVLVFNSQNLFIDGKAGFGAPETNYQEIKGFMQDGSTVQRFSLEERPLSFRIIIPPADGDTKEDFWEERNYLLSFFNPMVAPLKFRVTKSDGVSYELREVYPTPGITYTNVEAMASFIIDEICTLTAKNPVWYKSVVVNATPAETLNEYLEFPIEFPIQFGSEGKIFSVEVTPSTSGGMQMNYKTYPVITINGGYNTATVTNTWNNVAVTLYIPISEGEQRIIDFNPENLSIVDGNGVSRFDELTIESNLEQVYINPFIAGSIDVNLLNGTGGSSVVIEYNERYIGI